MTISSFQRYHSFFNHIGIGSLGNKPEAAGCEHAAGRAGKTLHHSSSFLSLCKFKPLRGINKLFFTLTFNNHDCFAKYFI